MRGWCAGRRRSPGCLPDPRQRKGPGELTTKIQAESGRERQARISGGASTWHGRGSVSHLSHALRAIHESSTGACILMPDKCRDVQRMRGVQSPPASLLSTLRHVLPMHDVEATGSVEAAKRALRCGEPALLAMGAPRIVYWLPGSAACHWMQQAGSLCGAAFGVPMPYCAL
ncbi:hypothetical protein B0H17DRAFT_1145994 [Mycena rosella]|uniref:Uncharacterized protein n=1 Tax=Mycena rosella TaxID=1033263 RepID=A0AAD7CPT6_MYCRO|nr:hypothetical protein B0H17DRAFT_1145994 [Mycena rosella]